MHDDAFFEYYTVADPGFPVGGGRRPVGGGGADLRRVHFSVKTYAKMKEMDPVLHHDWQNNPCYEKIMVNGICLIDVTAAAIIILKLMLLRPKFSALKNVLQF